MRITGLRVQNYKSFDDSDWVEFSDGFNVVVGKNSAGKTALLEAFRLSNVNTRPHLSITRRRDEPVNPQGLFQFEVLFSENELRDALLRAGGQIQFPVPSTEPGVGQRLVEEFFGAKSRSLKLQAYTNGGIGPLAYPSHGMFPPPPQQIFVAINPSPDKRSFQVVGPSGGSPDTVPILLNDLLPRKLFVFRAERLNIGEIGFGEEKVLSENAANLPRVLFSLATNPAMFDRYNRHVNQIFPYIKHVTVFPKGTRVWTHNLIQTSAPTMAAAAR